MKAALPLRALSVTEPALHRCVRALRAAGYDVTARRLAPPPRAVEIDAEDAHGRRHVGWLDLAGQLRQRYPALRELAWTAVDPRYALELLRRQPPSDAALPAPPGGWAAVRVVGLAADADADAAEALLCFDEAGPAPAYFRSFPLPPRPVRLDGYAATPVGALPLPLRCRLGCSTAPLELLRMIEPGDVLLMQTRHLLVTVGDGPLCAFRYDLETEEVMLNDPAGGMPPDLSGADVGVDVDGARPTFDVDALPVTLEFVLHEQPITVAELAELGPGAVLPLQPDCASRVAIRAAGLHFGDGELVQVGERLAVEVRSIRSATAGPRCR